MAQMRRLYSKSGPEEEWPEKPASVISAGGIPCLDRGLMVSTTKMLKMSSITVSVNAALSHST